MLLVLQIYKSSGAVDRATKWYNEFSAVDDYFLQIREIIVKNKKGRRIECNNNLFKYSESVI